MKHRSVLVVRITPDYVAVNLFSFGILVILVKISAKLLEDIDFKGLCIDFREVGDCLICTSPLVIGKTDRDILDRLFSQVLPFVKSLCLHFVRVEKELCECFYSLFKTDLSVVRPCQFVEDLVVEVAVFIFFTFKILIFSLFKIVLGEIVVTQTKPEFNIIFTGKPFFKQGKPYLDRLIALT